MRVLVSFTGPSAAGKTTLSRDLAAASHDFTITPVTSHTTRPMREGEVDNVDYYYVDTARFEALKTLSGGFVECIQMVGHSYGLHLTELRRVWNMGAVPVVMLDPQGLTQTAQYCAQHRIPYLPVFVDEKLPKLLARYLARVQRDDASRLDYHAARVESLVGETRWREEFTRILDAIDPNHPRIFISEYEGNESVVLPRLLDAVTQLANAPAATTSTPPGRTWQELQQAVVDWADAALPDRTSESAFLKLYKEIGEAVDNPRDGKEWADILIIALDMMHRYGITRPDEMVVTKLAELRTRQWARNELGVYSHIKDAT